jgi:hypothetical protein
MTEREAQGVEHKLLSKQERRAKELFTQSFRFSQGELFLQEQILKWLVAKGGFDGIEVPVESPAYIQEMLIPKKHKSITEGPKKELERAWGRLNIYATHLRQSISVDELQPTILRGMIDRDRTFQKGERPNRPDSLQVTPDSSNDRHASFVRKYIINGQPTGSDAFDELHRNLAPLVTKYQTATAKSPIDIIFNQEILFFLVKDWEKNHPGYTFFSPQHTPADSPR